MVFHLFAAHTLLINQDQALTRKDKLITNNLEAAYQLFTLYEDICELLCEFLGIKLRRITKESLEHRGAPFSFDMHATAPHSYVRRNCLEGPPLVAIDAVPNLLEELCSDHTLLDLIRTLEDARNPRIAIHALKGQFT